MDKYITLNEWQDLLADRFQNYDHDLAEHQGVAIPIGAKEAIQDIRNFDVRDDDTWVVSYPKAGTTWTQEIVSCAMHDGNMAEINKRHTAFRVPYFEQHIQEELRRPKNIVSCAMHDGNMAEINKRHTAFRVPYFEQHIQEELRRPKNLPRTIEIVDEMPSPRVIKSHLPGGLLPDQVWQKRARVIYVMRNPKDLLVSNFHFRKLYDKRTVGESFHEFFDKALAGTVLYGRWWDHFLYFCEQRHRPHVLLLRYEDMKRDLRGNVQKISRFLGKEFDDDVIDAITNHCQFASMSTNEMASMDTVYKSHKNLTGKFMRKGKVGDWKSYFTAAQNEIVDALVREKFRGTGLTFECGDD